MTKSDLIEFVKNWIEGTARAITVMDREMLVELLSCPAPFPDELGEEIGAPRGSTFGEVAGQIRDAWRKPGWAARRDGMNGHPARNIVHVQF